MEFLFYIAIVSVVLFIIRDYFSYKEQMTKFDYGREALRLVDILNKLKLIKQEDTSKVFWMLRHKYIDLRPIYSKGRIKKVAIR